MSDPTGPLAAVVVLNWNKARLTAECVAAAQAATEARVLWIVVDNGSAEATPELGPGVVVLRNTRNLGFCGGVNVGLAHAFAAGADYAWLLNNDAEPLPGALDAMLAHVRADPGIGLASPVILYADGSDDIAFHGGLWQDEGFCMTADPDEYARWRDTSPGNIWLVATALLVSRRLVETIGFFDEKLFAYCEDNDFCRRGLAAGFRNVVVETAKVRHDEGRPAQRAAARPPYAQYYLARNEILVMRKGSGFRRIRRFYWLLARARRRFDSLSALPAHRTALLKGLRDGVLGRGGVFRG